MEGEQTWCRFARTPRWFWLTAGALALALPLAAARGQEPRAAGNQSENDWSKGALPLDKLADGIIAKTESGRHWRIYKLSVSSRKAVKIDLESDDFDAQLSVYDSPSASEPILSDDDSGDGNDAQLTILNTSDRTKQYFVVAEAWGAESGAFRIIAASATARLPPPPLPLRLGVETGGTLSKDSAYDGIKSRKYVLFQVQEAVSQRVAIEATSPTLDLSLELLSEGKVVASDDDGGEGFSPLLLTELEAGRNYEVRVLADAGPESAFALRARSLPTPRASAPEPVTITSGQPAPVQFGDDQPVLLNNRPYALFRYKGVAGEKATIVIRPSEIARQLQVVAGADTAAGFASLQSSLALRRAMPPVLSFRSTGVIDIRVSGPVLFDKAFTITIEPLSADQTVRAEGSQ